MQFNLQPKNKNNKEFIMCFQNPRKGSGESKNPHPLDCSWPTLDTFM